MHGRWRAIVGNLSLYPQLGLLAAQSRVGRLDDVALPNLGRCIPRSPSARTHCLSLSGGAMSRRPDQPAPKVGKRGLKARAWVHAISFFYNACMFLVQWDEVANIDQPERVSPWEIEPFSAAQLSREEILSPPPPPPPSSSLETLEAVITGRACDFTSVQVLAIMIDSWSPPGR
ncbi:hypothetical protein Cni_G07573 [Canna indica]|uniref:Uncharacterized protein n=1 Tax=Canna indica TaxID=4628 RepID=A0AAQ3K2D0_9LILI|nr:hypothetical protein Cni_G07573 [Canna indica]